MSKHNLLFLTVLSIFAISCGSNSNSKSDNFKLDFDKNNGVYQLGEAVMIKLENKNDRKIDSAAFFIQEKKIKTNGENSTYSFPLQDQKLGKWTLNGKIYSEGEIDTLSKSITIHNNVSPVLYSYKIINTYSHDPSAYTQGLEFHNDTLYEGTGQRGHSSLRKTDFSTGKVLQKIDLEDQYFGEGITVLNNNIYQLTWQENKGFIYNLNSLEKTGTFQYSNSKEGWGLTNNGKTIFKSDGSEKIWYLNAETLAEESYIQPTHNTAIVNKLNELEWVDGKIYANTYQKDGVAIINPETGAIEGIVNFSGLRDKLGNTNDLDPGNDVLNGIAYNPNTKKLYVTGKMWDKLFEVELVKK